MVYSNKITNYLLKNPNINFLNHSKTTNSYYFNIGLKDQKIRISDHLGAREVNTLEIIETTNNNGFIVVKGADAMLYLNNYAKLRDFLRNYIFLIMNEDQNNIVDTQIKTESKGKILDLSNLTQNQIDSLTKTYNSYIHKK